MTPVFLFVSFSLPPSQFPLPMRQGGRKRKPRGMTSDFHFFPSFPVFSSLLNSTAEEGEREKGRRRMPSPSIPSILAPLMEGRRKERKKGRVELRLERGKFVRVKAKSEVTYVCTSVLSHSTSCLGRSVEWVNRRSCSRTRIRRKPLRCTRPLWRWPCRSLGSLESRTARLVVGKRKLYWDEKWRGDCVVGKEEVVDWDEKLRGDSEVEKEGGSDGLRETEKSWQWG